MVGWIMKNISSLFATPACVAALVLAGLLAPACGQVSVDPGYVAMDVVNDGGDLDGLSDAGDDDAQVATDAQEQDVPSGPKCETDTDCLLKVTGQTPCKLATCQAGICTAPLPLAKGTACSQPNLAPTQCQVATCDDVGECVLEGKPDGDKCGFTKCG